MPDARPVCIDGSRKARFRKVVGMFLDGTADRDDDLLAMRRYAHVFKGSLSVTVTDSDLLIDADEETRSLYEDAGFKYVGTIDLDDGELVAASGETALGRVTAPSGQEEKP